MKKIVLLLVCLAINQAIMSQIQTIDLSGVWRFQLDPIGFGKTPGSELYLRTLSETVMLPGSTDQSGKGIRTTARYIDRLTRKFEYQGMAWYQREIVIPDDWRNREIILHLERCHWETAVYVNGKPAGTGERLSTPNRFILSKWLTPGVHTLTLCVDNRLKYPMDQWNHGTTEYTQTNWNGIVGTIALEAREKVYIKRLHVYPDPERKKIRVSMDISSASVEKSGQLTFKVREKGGDEIVSRSSLVDLSDTTGIIHEIDMGKTVKLWDEFTPNLYLLEASLATDELYDSREVSFGMQRIEQGQHHIRLNDRNIHLRGTLDCAVFPRTGYPSTDVAEWRRIFETIKSYGMNHVRYHSWCPPEAAFEAADELGVYLQVELPMWIKDVGKHPARRDFFEDEMYAVLDEYGNHPSFILMCNGNENEGDFDVLEDLVVKARQYDNRRLYSASTARKHVKADQYYVSHVTEKGAITVYEGNPSTMWDRSKESDIDVPVIAHETGQRCMYPDFNEVGKYTGVMEPRNFEVFRERLAGNGMLHQAADFFKATGAHTVLQYKEVNEALLRTPNSGGFQLLGLSDFPGQGSAFVGVLDAFWESKGLVSPEKYRESCAPTVLLARFPQRIYTSEETFIARLDVYHFGKEPIRGKNISWRLETEMGGMIGKGSQTVKTIPCSTVDSIGLIAVDLKNVVSAQKLTLKVQLGNIGNEWDIWVYPHREEFAVKDFEYVRAWNDETRKMLAQGKKVLLIPEKCKGRKARFASHFWNPVMFRNQPMIVGTLIDHTHPVFSDFPTAWYADWQWHDILNYSTALELNELKELTPIIQSVDTYEFNRKLGIAFEAQVGNGKLFVLAVDPEKDLEKRAATRQLLSSVEHYMASKQFNPVCQLQYYQLDALFSSVAGWLMEMSLMYKSSVKKGVACKINNPWEGAHVQLIRNGKPDQILGGEMLTFSTHPEEQD